MKNKNKQTKCIGCAFRQQELNQLALKLQKQEQEHKTAVPTETIECILTCRTNGDDVLIYDSSHRLYQHFIKDPDVMEEITADTDTYSLQMFSSFLEKLLSATLSEELYWYYERWEWLFHQFKQQETFWCTARFEEQYGTSDDNKNKTKSFVRYKKINFYFTKK